jgi:Flp pilus assembly protein protease CpaA
MPAFYDTLVVGAMLLVATFTDLRRREVPGWLTFGGIAPGVLVASTNGTDSLLVSLLGMMVGGLLVLPFVLIGAFGAADALILVAIGAWMGPLFVLWTAWWMSLTGAGLAILAWRRGQSAFPYVPAISLGACFANLTT